MIGVCVGVRELQGICLMAQVHQSLVLSTQFDGEGTCHAVASHRFRPCLSSEPRLHHQIFSPRLISEPCLLHIRLLL